MLRYTFAFCLIAGLAGCGGFTEEAPPTELPKTMSPEEAQQKMKESMEKAGNAAKYRQVPGQN